MQTQKDTIKDIFEQNPKISAPDLVKLAKEKYQLELNPHTVASTLTGLRKEFYGSEKNTKKEYIQKACQEYPYATAPEIVTILEEQGVQVSLPYVHIVRSESKESSNNKSNKEQPDINDLQFLFDYMQQMNNGRQRINHALEIIKPLWERFESLDKLEECLKFIQIVRK